MPQTLYFHSKKPLHPLSTRVSESHSQAEYFWRTVKSHVPASTYPPVNQPVAYSL